ncbi:MULTISPECIES: hypothetical protein [unclassified Paenibacillus]|uniref:hypothetical protein n=1 Tax=unclassified Paenibacillus TaxID=185978 RepID=UPI002F3F29DF
MGKELLQDTLSLLNELIHKQTNIELDVNDRSLQELADMIGSYGMARSRKMTVLSCCMLISVGIRKHNKLLRGDNDRLARSILDGDYLVGLIYRVAVSRKEQKLLARLTPIYKKMQLKSLEGGGSEGIMTELKQEIKAYLDQHSA